MNKITRTLLCSALLVGSIASVTSCGGGSQLKAIAKEDIKIGLICLHDESSTYDKNFIESMQRAATELGLGASQVVIKRGVDETED